MENSGCSGEIQSIQREDIEAFFECLKSGRELSDEWSEIVHTPMDQEEWFRQIQLHTHRISAEYSKNSSLVNHVLKPLMEHPEQISDWQFECLFVWTKDMYQNNYDDPYTLYQLADLILPHFEEKKNLDYLMFCYQAKAYAAMEISRTGNRKLGRESVRIYKKMLTYKYRLEEMKVPSSRVSIFIAYSNLIRTECTLGNLTARQIYLIWKNYRRYREDPYSRQYDEEIPRIPHLCQFFDEDFRTYSLNTYYEDVEKKDGTLGKYFNPKLCRTLSGICRSYLESIMEDEEHLLEVSPDLYCNYQQLLAFGGEISWDTAWKRMTEFHKMQQECSDKMDWDENDPVAWVVNSLQRMIDALYRSSFSAEKKNEVALGYCDEIIRFARENCNSNISYTINGALEGFFFTSRLLSCIQDPKEKEHLMINFVITRHASTYMHCKMVQKAAALILNSILNNCPELMIGVCGTRTAKGVRKKQGEIKNFAAKAALFHDIGKNSLADIITTEHRKISDEEFAAIKLHPEQGAKYLSVDPAFRKFRDVAIGHHKFYNGRGGYPASFDNTASKDKPMIDLITICDCLDAATDYLSRNYQNVKTLEQVIKEFQDGAGTRYHPGIVELLGKDRKLCQALERLITKERKDIYYKIYEKSLKI